MIWSWSVWSIPSVVVRRWQMLNVAPALHRPCCWARGLSEHVNSTSGVYSRVFCRAAVQGEGGCGNLVLHPHAIRVWAAARSGNGRVPVKIKGSRLNRRFSYRPRQLCASFSAKLFLMTKPGFFPLTIHVLDISM